MHNIVLRQVIQRDEYLNSKSLYQVQGEPLEIVHLDKFVQVDREHFKGYY